MLGHAVANTVVVAAANRTGEEGELSFYGSSFVCDQAGVVTAELNRTETGFRIVDVDVERVRKDREWFGLLRDRRPDLYASLKDD